jgi:hypothetical protein
MTGPTGSKPEGYAGDAVSGDAEEPPPLIRWSVRAVVRQGCSVIVGLRLWTPACLVRDIVVAYFFGPQVKLTPSSWPTRSYLQTLWLRVPYRHVRTLFSTGLLMAETGSLDLSINIGNISPHTGCVSGCWC